MKNSEDAVGTIRDLKSFMEAKPSFAASEGWQQMPYNKRGKNTKIFEISSSQFRIQAIRSEEIMRKLIEDEIGNEIV